MIFMHCSKVFLDIFTPEEQQEVLIELNGLPDKIASTKIKA